MIDKNSWLVPRLKLSQLKQTLEHQDQKRSRNFCAGESCHTRLLYLDVMHLADA
jgi:hypothetical protein